MQSCSHRGSLEAWLALFALALLFFLGATADDNFNQLDKRSGYSDQRLAELETLAALKAMRQRLNPIIKRSGYSDQRLAELETLAGLKSLRNRFSSLNGGASAKIGKRPWSSLREDDADEDGSQFAWKQLFFQSSPWLRRSSK